MTFVPRRARLASLLAVALGALALIALPGAASAQPGGDHSNGRENAGTIASFDEETGALTIDLREGGSVTALVGEETRILCVGPRGRRNGHEHHHARGHGKGHGQGEESGEGSDEKSATPPRRARRQDRRRGHPHPCTTDALVEGAVVRKAEIETAEETEVFDKIMVSKPRPANAANAEEGGEGHHCDHGEGAAEEGDDEGGDEEGPITS